MLFLYFIILSLLLILGGYLAMPFLPRKLNVNLLNSQNPYCLSYLLNRRTSTNLICALLSLKQKGLIKIVIENNRGMISKNKTTNQSDLLDFEACLLNELGTNNRTGFYSLYKNYSSIHNENFKLLEKQYDSIGEQSRLRFGKDTTFAKTYNYTAAVILTAAGGWFSFLLYQASSKDYLFMLLLTALAIIFCLNLEHKTTYGMTPKGEKYAKKLKEGLQTNQNIASLLEPQNILIFCLRGSISLGEPLLSEYNELNQIIRERREREKLINRKVEYEHDFDSCSSCDSCSCS